MNFSKIIILLLMPLLILGNGVSAIAMESGAVAVEIGCCDKGESYKECCCSSSESEEIPCNEGQCDAGPCVLVVQSFLFSSEMPEEAIYIDSYSKEKIVSHHPAFLPDGFNSIWNPPKIIS